MLATDKFLASLGLTPAGTRGEELSFLANNREKVHYLPKHEANTVFGKLTNQAVYRQMAKIAGYEAVTDAKEFTFHLPVGYTGDMDQGLKGGYGAKHILINEQHIARIHDHYHATQKTPHRCASLMACLNEFLDFINDLDQPERSDKVALAWEENGKFVLVARMPFKTGHDHYLLCVFVPDTDYRFSIITFYPVSHYTFEKIKYGNARFIPIFPEEAPKVENAGKAKNEAPVKIQEPTTVDLGLFKPEKKKPTKKKKEKPAKAEASEEVMDDMLTIETLAEKGVIQESTCLKFIKRTKPELRQKMREICGKHMQGLIKDCQEKFQTQAIIKENLMAFINSFARFEEEFKKNSQPPRDYKNTDCITKYLNDFFKLYTVDFEKAVEKESEEYLSIKNSYRDLVQFIKRNSQRDNKLFNTENINMLGNAIEIFEKYITAVKELDELFIKIVKGQLVTLYKILIFIQSFFTENIQLTMDNMRDYTPILDICRHFIKHESFYTNILSKAKLAPAVTILQGLKKNLVQQSAKDPEGLLRMLFWAKANNFAVYIPDKAKEKENYPANLH